MCIRDSNTALWQPIISTRSALEKLKKRIRKYTSLVKIRRTVYYASQIAAIIAIAFIFHTVKESNAYSATTHTVLTSTHKSEVTLPDGTIVWLNNNTKLIYPEVFSSTERSVYRRRSLFQGHEKQSTSVCREITRTRD